MTVTILRGDALHLPLADSSVDLICTSPPYFALRSYTDSGAHYSGQLGSERTPQEWLENLWKATAEIKRVLKPTGSAFINLGDKYSGAQSQNFDGQARTSSAADTWARTDPKRTGIPNKSLMLLPERYRIGAVDRLGLIARAVIIWDKPNGLPESVTDRVRRSHEDWVHLVKQPRYYSAVDEVREDHQPQSLARTQRNRFAPDLSQNGVGAPNTLNPVDACNPLGKLPGSVWQIPTEPLTVPPELGVDHFAAYPTEWPRRIIAGWSPPGICQECGQGRRPIATMGNRPEGLHAVQRRTRFTHAQRARWTRMFTDALATKEVDHRSLDDICGTNGMAGHWTTQGDQVAIPTPEQWDKITAALGVFSVELEAYVHATEWVPYYDTQDNGTGIRTEQTGRHRLTNRWGRGSAASITGYMCACPTPDAPTRPARILDPFGGTGTTALVADVLGRHGIHIDLSHDYNRLAKWRTTDPAQRARAAHVDKPPPVIDGQLTLEVGP